MMRIAGYIILLFIIHYSLFISEASAQVLLDDLEWAPDSNYMVITAINGRPIYIPKDSLAGILSAGNIYIDTMQITDDTLEISLMNDQMPLSRVDLKVYEESQDIADTAAVLRTELRLTITQPSEPQRADSNYLIFDQYNIDTVEWYLSGPIFGDQLLELDGNDLSITGGNTVDLTDIVPRIDGIETTLSTISYTPAFTLPSDMNRINVYLNGVRLWYTAGATTHIGEYNIISGTIYFHEALSNDQVSILIF